MNVRWCAPSVGGCSGVWVSDVVSASTHGVCPGCTGLMAGPAQRACGTGVANLDLVTVHPAVPDLVPSRFGVAPVRGADTGICQGGWSSRRGRGWDAGHAHSCNEELNVCVCVNSTSSTLSLSPPADYRVPGAVFSGHLGAAVTKIKDATLTSPGARGRPLALLHPMTPKRKI
jgi:hypothetical protein